MATTGSPKKKSLLSRISCEQEITLNHHLAQRLFKRFYAQADHSLFVSTKVLREERRDEEAARIESAALSLCDKIEASLTQAADTFMTKATEARVQVNAGQSDQVVTQQATYSTGCSLRVLDLFYRLDRLLMLIEVLGLHNLCSAEEANSLVRYWHSEFRHFLIAIISVRNKPDTSSVQTATPVDHA